MQPGVRAVGPNEHCPCGSGRKYKKCHGRPSAQASKPWMPVAVVLGLALAGAAIYMMQPQGASTASGAVPAGSAAGAPARLGSPWEYDAASNTHFDPSPGHNHWHSGPPPAGR